MRRFILIIIAGILAYTFVCAGSFEGRINVVKRSFYDTVYYSYLVKDSMVRIDEFNTLNQLTGSYIIDMREKKIVALNINQKVYKEIVPKKTAQNIVDPSNYEIIKTDNIRVINGLKCYQWRVRNKSKNTEICYWVTKDGFYFYKNMLTMLNNIGNLSEFFLQIPDNKGYMPVLAVERTLVRYEKFSLAVTDIERSSLNKNLFIIPKDFKAIEY